MDRLFSNILETIEAAAPKFKAAKLKPAQTIDVYLGQPERPEDFEFFTPAVFIDMSADYANETGYVYVYVVQRYGADSENFADERQSGLWYFRFLTILKHCLIGIKTPPVFGALQLYQENAMSMDNFHYHQLVFSFTIYDELDDLGKYVDTDVYLKLQRGKLAQKISAGVATENFDNLQTYSRSYISFDFISIFNSYIHAALARTDIRPGGSAAVTLAADANAYLLVPDVPPKYSSLIVHYYQPYASPLNFNIAAGSQVTNIANNVPYAILQTQNIPLKFSQPFNLQITQAAQSSGQVTIVALQFII